MAKETFDWQVRTSVAGRQSHKCYMECNKHVLGDNKGCFKKEGLEFHHLVENTIPNRKKYGKLIQGEENCVMLCNYCHTNKRHLLKDLKDALIDAWNYYEGDL